MMWKNPLPTIMNPESIVYLGGSNSLQTIGTAQLMTLVTSGYKGKIYPIHRKEKTVLGLQAYPNISSIGKPVDLAVIVILDSSIADEADHCSLDVPLFSPALQEKIKVTIQLTRKFRVHNPDFLLFVGIYGRRIGLCPQNLLK